MNGYLLAEANRDALDAHNPELVVTTTRKVGQAEYVSYDFNVSEEHRRLDTVLTGPALATLTVRAVSVALYGREDDELIRRVRSALRYNSKYQKTMLNGKAVIARKDGTLFVTVTADDYGDLVETNAAEAVDRMRRSVAQGTKRLRADFAAAVDKVPELHDRLGDTAATAKAALGSFFDRQLSLLDFND
jgi:hypothetical protein